MVNIYITHVIRCLHKSNTLDVAEISKLIGASEDFCKNIIDNQDNSYTEGLTLEHVDRMVEFFGMAVFGGNFCKELFTPQSSHYRNWESLEADEKKMVNIGTALSSVTAKSSASAIGYTKECSHFLESCEQMISVIKESGSSDDGTDDSEI